MSNKHLTKAKKGKNDEFYTQYQDIEEELKHYNVFDNSIVYCNCDNENSNFVKYFINNFDKLKLKKLIASHYPSGIYLEYDGTEIIKNTLNSNGSYDSNECITLLKESDIVITNPPFSLFRNYIALLMKYNKKFLVIGNMNAIIYKKIFPLIKNSKMWLGYNCNKTMEFQVPPTYEFKKGKFRKDEKGNYYIKVPSINWFTNLKIDKENKELILTKKYSPEEYPKYDNYDVINVDRLCDIPKDYYDEMGVPITFIDKYNPKQFEIIDEIGRYSMLTGPTEETQGKYLAKVNGKLKFSRIIIKRKGGTR